MNPVPPVTATITSEPVYQHQQAEDKGVHCLLPPDITRQCQLQPKPPA